MAIGNPKNSPLASCYIAFSSPEDADREHDFWIYNLFLYCFCTILKKKRQPWFVSSFEQTIKLFYFIRTAKSSTLCTFRANIRKKEKNREKERGGERERGREGERDSISISHFHYFFFSIFSFFFFVQFIVRSHFRISIFWRMENPSERKVLCSVLEQILKMLWNLFSFFFFFLISSSSSSFFLRHLFQAYFLILSNAVSISYAEIVLAWSM